jgi:choline dehydrogenase
MSEIPDYLIVGAGSAGSILAARLATESNSKIVLLEAGGTDRKLSIEMPLGYGLNFYNPKVNWQYQSEPVPGLGGRSLYTPRGKVIGGSGSINAMVYIRGNRQDFTDWQNAGNPGWGPEQVWPAYEAIENTLKLSSLAEAGHPLCQAFFVAAQDFGYPLNHTPNGPDQMGVGWSPMNIHHGKRRSSAIAFLHPAMARRNLRVITHAAVTRILIDRRKAIGVQYWQHGQLLELRAHTIILCAGAFATPQLLQVSGVGDPRLLKSIGVETLLASPRVGMGLQDHAAHDIYYRASRPSMNEKLRPLHMKAWAAFNYMVFRRGPLAWSMNQANGFVPVRNSETAKTIQLYFCPSTYDRSPPGKRVMTEPDPFPGFSLTVSNCRPTSRGSVMAKSADMRDAPAIQPNLLDTLEDQRDMLDGFRLMRKLAAHPALAAITAEETKPGSEIQSVPDIMKDLRNRAYAIFHPCGTCAMGPNGVVDHHLKVRGIDNLRIADASVFPNITTGNINAPAMLVGWKAADLILKN